MKKFFLNLISIFEFFFFNWFNRIKWLFEETIISNPAGLAYPGAGYSYQVLDVDNINTSKIRSNSVSESSCSSRTSNTNSNSDCESICSSDLSDIVDSDLNSYILLDKGIGKFIDISLKI